MVLLDSNRVPRVPLYSGTYSPLFKISLTGLSPSMVSLSNEVQLSIQVGFIVGPTTPREPKFSWFGLFRVRSPLLTESRLIYIPWGTKMFQLPQFASLLRETPSTSWVGFPIQKSPDLSLLSGSPRHIVAMPRLSSLPNAKASSVYS